METKADDSDTDDSRPVSSTSYSLALPPRALQTGCEEKEADFKSWALNPSMETVFNFSYVNRRSWRGPPRNDSVWATQDETEIPVVLPHYKRASTPGMPVPVEEGSGMSVWRERMFVFTVCLAQLFSLAGLAQSIAPLLVISDSFGVNDPGKMSWYTAAYSMTLGTFILPAGRLGDMFGHRRMFIIGWVWFGVCSIICGFSFLGGPIMLSTCRGLQGIGPALLVPNGIALLGRTFPIGMKRAMAIAVFGGCGPVGFVIGTVFSSIFAQLLWWPWAFWTTAIACAFACGLSYFAIPEDIARTPLPGALPESRNQFDLLGSVTGVTGLLLINFALNEAPCEGWDVAYIPVLLGIGVLLMVAFVYVELCVAARPIVPLRGLHRDAAFTLACIAAGWASHGIWSYYFFLFLQEIRNHTPLLTAAEWCPVAPVGFCAALAVPALLTKIRVPWLMSAAMLVFTLSIALLLTAPPSQTYWANTFVSILIAPFAMNWSFPSATILMSNAVAKHHQGIAASLVATMVNYSIATGLGIAGTIARYTTPTQGVLGGYRDAWWLGLAFGLAGFAISLYFICQSRARSQAIRK
ncbi:MFS general substrate transporter [Lecanosticta acicola]|uniref:MFS general substrate transporter n=1 Tax=Lecanosticta acicola TaxID=111012 RepID=A0AAI9ECW0_9PEZI|nr:MFS general substrate transporter [Lecanosticta acicola]